MSPQPPSPITVRPIQPTQTHALRHRVLRPHQTLAEMRYERDDEPGTVHLGAFDGGGGTGEPVGVVTLNVTPVPVGMGLARRGDRVDWRLRGMAVDEGMQGRGVGRALVLEAIASAKHGGAGRLWCNARVSAMGFYKRLGFVTAGDEFDIPVIGPHYVMWVGLR